MMGRFAGICAAVVGNAVVSYLIGSAIKGADLELVGPFLFAIHGFTVGWYLAFGRSKLAGIVAAAAEEFGPSKVAGILAAAAEGGLVTASLSSLLVLLFVAVGVVPTPKDLLAIPALAGSGAFSGLCYALVQKCLFCQSSSSTTTESDG